MVNKERVQLLVDALKSGEFKQTYMKLEGTVDGEVSHCCLGVACRVSMRNGLDLITKGRVNGLTSFGCDLDCGMLPAEVRKWFGFDSSNPLININGKEYRAVDANDKFGLGFLDIANGFEARYITNEDEE